MSPINDIQLVVVLVLHCSTELIKRVSDEQYNAHRDNTALLLTGSPFRCHCSPTVPVCSRKEEEAHSGQPNALRHKRQYLRLLKNSERQCDTQHKSRIRREREREPKKREGNLRNSLLETITTRGATLWPKKDQREWAQPFGHLLLTAWPTDCLSLPFLTLMCCCCWQL